MADDAAGISSHAPCHDTPRPGPDETLLTPPTGLDASGLPFGYNTFANNVYPSDSDSETRVGDGTDWIALVVFLLVLLFIVGVGFGSFGSQGTFNSP